MTSTYLSYLTFERTYGRPIGPIDTAEAENDRTIQDETEYFRQNIGKVSTGTELVADERLYNYVLTAFALTDQADNSELIRDVLNQGIFDPYTKPGRDDPPVDNPINTAAEEFWFDQDFVFSFEKEAQINSIALRYRASIADNYPTRSAADIDAEVDYFRARVELTFSGEELVRDDRLFTFVTEAFSLENQRGNREIIGQAIDAGVYNPAAGVLKTDSLANTLEDSRFNTLARAFGFNEVGDANTKNQAFLDNVADRYARETLEAEKKAELEAATRQGVLPAQNQLEIEYFRENIGKVTSIDDLVDDERLYRFVLTAYDLETQIPYKGLIRKVLEEGITDDQALANTLVDTKFRVFAGALGFAEVGTQNVRNPNFAEDVIEQYERVTVETNAGEDNLGVRLAAYFDRQGPSITSWFNVLGDRALREVVFTAFSLPDEMQQTNPDRLVQIFEDRFDIEDFQDPEKRAKFIQQFTVLYDVKNGAPGGPASNVLSLYGVFPEDTGGGTGGASIAAATLGATLF